MNKSRQRLCDRIINCNLCGPTDSKSIDHSVTVVYKIYVVVDGRKGTSEPTGAGSDKDWCSLTNQFLTGEGQMQIMHLLLLDCLH